MTRRKAAVFGAMFAFGIAALVVVAWPLVAVDPISSATRDRVQDGMSVDEVVSLVGLSPGDHRNRPLPTHAPGYVDLAREQCQGSLMASAWSESDRKILADALASARRSYHAPRKAEDNVPLKEWLGNHGALFVYFDENGRAKASRYIDYGGRKTFVARFRDWLAY